jgi:DNA-binding XRE family transcriptional regulator
MTNGKNSMIAIGEEKGPTPAELAQLIRGLRERHEWSQAALAASAGLSERTIQRVENAEGSNRQTRRSMAKAFGFGDRDIFEKPVQIPSLAPFSNIERMISDFLQKRSEHEKSVEKSGVEIRATLDVFMVELEKFTELIQITPIRNGRTLRTMLEQSTFQSVEEFGDHIPAAREAFAKLENYLDNYHEIARAKIESLPRGKLDDFLKDPRNIAHEFSATERIRIDADLDALLARILEQHCVVGAGFNVEIHPQNRDPLLRIHIMLAPDAAFPVKIRVPRAAPIQIRRPAVTSKDGGTDRGSKS